MSTVPLAKPQTVGSTYLTGDIGITGSDDFRFKIAKWSCDSGSPAQDVTGDGDTYPSFENNLFLYATYVFEGYLLSGETLGLANLVDAAKNPTGSVVLKVHSNTRTHTVNLIVERVQIMWESQGAFVPARVYARMTDSTIVEA